MFARRLSFLALAASTAALFLFGAGCPIQSGDPIDDEDTGFFDEDDTDDGIDPFDSGMDDDDTGMTEDDTGTTDTGTPEDSGMEEEDTQDYACDFFPDSCPDGQNCYPSQSGGRMCGSYTEGAQPGDQCSALNECGDLQLCTQDNTCQKRCDPDKSSSENRCDSSASCAAPQDADVGICVQGCEQFPNDSCPQGENCYPTQSGATTCAAYDDTASVGDSCSRPTDCNNNQVCVQDQSGNNVCADKCTQEGDGPCSANDCQPLQSVDYGVCPMQ